VESDWRRPESLNGACGLKYQEEGFLRSHARAD
jgi:hypothetical protein